MNELKRHPGADLTKFTSDYLKRDGLFITRLLSDNMGDIVAADVLSGLWEFFCAHRHAQIEDIGERKPLRRELDAERDEKRAAEGVDRTENA